MVLMRSRCNWEGGKELGQWGRGGGEWLEEQGVAGSKRAYTEVLSWDSQTPQCSQSTRSLRVNMYSASTISKQWKLPTAVIYWAPLSTRSAGGLQGFHCSHERFRHKNLPLSFPHLWIGQYLQTELDLQNFPYCQICNCQPAIHQAVWHGLE